jgi:hypothetical protein
MRCLMAVIPLLIGVSCAMAGAQDLPKVTTVSEFAQERCGAYARDDFDDGKYNWDYFHEWLNNKSFRYEETRGKLRLHIEEPAAFNGWDSKPTAQTDLVLAARVDSRSVGSGESHSCLTHMCAGSGESPDYWLDLVLKDGGEKAPGTVEFSLNPNVPPYAKAGVPKWEPLVWTRRPGEKGYNVKLERTAGDGKVRCYVELGGKWTLIGAPYELPMRTTKVELKLAGGGEGVTTDMWFDDFRLYPFPATHYVMVRAAGLPSEYLGPDGKKRTQGDFVVKLFKADGATVVGEVDLYAYGCGLIPLRAADWEIYPQSAIFRCYIAGQQVGEDMRVEAKGVAGLYPDDAWVFTVGDGGAGS